MVLTMQGRQTFAIDDHYLVDMREIYREILRKPIIQTTNTPTNPILIGQTLPGDVEYIGLKLSEMEPIKFLLFDRKVAVQQIPGLYREAALSVENDTIIFEEQFPFILSYDMTELYGTAVLLTTMLDVECPQIVVADMDKVSPGMSGLAINPDETGQRTTTIYLKLQSFVEMEKTLAHELRHAWQHKYKQEEFFDTYNTYDSFSKKEKDNYYFQPAEVDAESYAWAFMKSHFGVDFRGTKNSKRVNRRLATEMKKHSF